MTTNEVQGVGILSTPLGNICVDAVIGVSHTSQRTVRGVPYRATPLPTSEPYRDRPGVEFAVDGRYLIVPVGLADLNIARTDYPILVRCYVEESPDQHFGPRGGCTSGECSAGKTLCRGNVEVTIACRDSNSDMGNPLVQDVATGVEQTYDDLREAFFLVSWLQSDLLDESKVLDDIVINWTDFASDAFSFWLDGGEIIDHSNSPK